MKPLRSWSLVLLVMLMAAPRLPADTVMTRQTHSDGFTIMGQTQPEKNATATTWFGKDAIRMDDGDKVTIVRTDPARLYLLQPAQKTYSALDLPIDFKKLMPPEMAPMADQMLKMALAEVKVTATGETKKIRDWNTTRYTVQISNPMGMQITQEIWATKDVALDFAAYWKLAAKVNSLQPGLENLAKEMEKIEGLPVLVEATTQMMNTSFKSRDELVSVETKAPPAGTYEVPTGFREVPFNAMAAPGR